MKTLPISQKISKIIEMKELYKRIKEMKKEENTLIDKTQP